MPVTRREFVKISTMSAAALLLMKERAWAAFPTSPALLKFGPGQRLRLFGPDILLAKPAGTDRYGADYYEIAMRQFTDQLHPDLGPTTLRGYADFTAPTPAPGAPPYKQKHLEGAILATVNTPVRVKFINEFPEDLPLPVDTSLIKPYAFGQYMGNDRAVPHLHGGLVPWPSDGGPFHWFNNPNNPKDPNDPNGPRIGSIKGPSVIDWLPDGLGNKTDDYWYPNRQSARFMWYHDHAVGLTRLNPYLGLASGYILTDADEGLLPSAGPTLMKMLGIPEGDLTRQVHLVVQDKIFMPSTYSPGSTGDLWYPETYDTQFFGALAKTATESLPHPSLVPEFWGDTMLVNGTVYPFFEVEPRRYRFRILNACNTRVLSLRLVGALGRRFPANTEPDVANPGPVMTLIGTEGGFLDGTLAPKGVVYDNTVAMPLVLAPAERADIIIDFSKVKTTSKDPLCFILHNDAPVPFPGGTPLADFFTGSKKNPASGLAGYGPNTRTLLQFKVLPLGALTDNTSPDPSVDPAWVLPPSPEPTAPPVRERGLALYETVDEFGRLAQNLGELAGPLTQLATPTEVVKAGTVEVWRIFNITADTHPIHFHYFNVRVVKREPFSWRGGMPNITGNPLPPDPAEQGWKETVKFNPGECTTLLVEMPPTDNLAPAGVTVPSSPRLETYTITVPDPDKPGSTKEVPDPSVQGAEYVWHCHILEHEEHDMMRPLVVQG